MTAGLTLDRIDRRILAALQAEGRLTNQSLSEKVALSPSACLARVRRLEEAGVIQGYHARLDPFMLEVGLVLYAEVTLREHGPEAWRQFEAAVQAIPQLVEASHVSGPFDYLLKAVVADMNEWAGIRERMTEAGADRINTFVMMSKPKIFVGYPVRDS